MKKRLFLVLLPLLLFSCKEEEGNGFDKSSVVTELITRKSDQHIAIPTLKRKIPLRYPWEEFLISTHPKITKEFFRCKGTRLNPEKIVDRNGKPHQIVDCEGSDRHSLPLKDNREYIPKIFITLLNHIQITTGKRVVITSGHRCPEHNMYVDPSFTNSFSKHMIGAEVSFFVQGMENHPEESIKIIFEYYKKISPFRDNAEFANFQRYEKSDTNVSIKPWFNKEIFIKLFNKEEGRNFDNRHPYPYIALQARYDTELGEPVFYSWDKAYKNYLRK